MTAQPQLILGGMGVGVGSWQLARSVALARPPGECIGTVSLVAPNYLVARTLQHGDPGGHIRRIAASFCDQRIAKRMISRNFIEGGLAPNQDTIATPVIGIPLERKAAEDMVFSALCLVSLAKEGHDGLIGVNLMEKLNVPNVPALYGALLAGVDYVFMGAGLPDQYPSIITSLVDHRPATLKVPIYDEASGRPDQEFVMFDPSWIEGDKPALKRSKFGPIISTNLAAMALMRHGGEKGIDCLIVESPTAGGHNAPPRAKPMPLNDHGEPIYGDKDIANLEQIASYGLPFYLAGGYDSSEKLREALQKGAAGIQIGSRFALCQESGMNSKWRQQTLKQIVNGTLEVRNNPIASPTGFPIHIVQLEGTLSDPEVSCLRDRLCDVHLLARYVRKSDGQIIRLCPAEPVESYIRKGGSAEDTIGRVCLCNALLATTCKGAVRNGIAEPAIVTLGEEIAKNEEYRQHMAARVNPDGTVREESAAEIVNDILG